MDRVWITWDDHRRSRELSAAFKCSYVVISSTGPSGISHFKNIVKTTVFLVRSRKALIFVQNPSRILAALSAFLKLFFGFRLIVDRHTNFRIGKPIGYDPREWFAVLCSEFSLRFSDLTIVTNDFLREYVIAKGGKSLVLPDRIPYLDKEHDFIRNNSKSLEIDPKIVVFICTFANDEPYLEVIRSAQFLNSNIRIYVTGKYNERVLSSIGEVPENVFLTGYLPDNEYEGLLHSANVILDFTTLEWCLVCGGYEAMSVEKPFVTSDTVALKEFYQEGALYSDHSPEDIAKKIIFSINNENELAIRLKNRAKKVDLEWQRLFSDIQIAIDKI